MWIVCALLSALFAGATTLLAKAGVRDADSDIVTAVRTAVILAVTAVVVLCEGLLSELKTLTLRDWALLIGSGVCTGASWLCCFRALKLGPVGKVMAVDKTSTLLTMLIGILFFADPVNGWKLAGMALILAGSLAMVGPLGSRGRAPAIAGGTALPKPRTGQEELSGSAAAEGERGRDFGESVSERENKGRGTWLFYAVLSAVFASLQSVLAKLGMSAISSHTATLVRTAVVLLFAWGIVAARGKLPEVRGLGGRTLAFALLSGVTAGLSWLLYYMAVQTGILSAVAAIDKLSLLVSVGLAALIFREKLSVSAAIGLLLLVGGTLLFLV